MKVDQLQNDAIYPSPTQYYQLVKRPDRRIRGICDGFWGVIVEIGAAKAVLIYVFIASTLELK